MYILESTLESTISGWPALEPRPRSPLPPNPMPKWNSGGPRYRLIPSQHTLLVLKGDIQCFVELIKCMAKCNFTPGYVSDWRVLD